MDPSLTYCPSCGALLKGEPDLDEITVEIAGKVDSYMNEEKEAASEEKEAQTKTIKVTESTLKDSLKDSGVYEEDIQDTVFPEEPQKAEKNTDKEIGKESSQTQEAAGREPSKKEEPPKKKKSRKGLIAGIITAAIIIVVAVAVCIFLIFKVVNTQEEETESEAVEDVISCSVSEGEEYSAPLEITLESEMGNRLYYTLDGTVPSVSSTAYSQTITLDDSYVEDADGTEITLKVCSYSENSIKCGEIEITFTLIYSDVEAPEINPSSGNYSSETYITITAESGAKIYYTTDGTTPTEESSLYTGQIEMERGNTVLSAIAVKNGVVSPVATAVYNLEIESLYSFNEARDIVLECLLNQGKAEDEEGNTEEGYVEFMDGGTCIIDNDQYIVVICSFYNEDGENIETLYYGVDDQTGSYAKLTKTDSGYTK